MWNLLSTWQKLARLSTASRALALACRPSISKKKKKKKKKKTHHSGYHLFLHLTLANFCKVLNIPRSHPPTHKYQPQKLLLLLLLLLL
jgi:hypothetical protein